MDDPQSVDAMARLLYEAVTQLGSGISPERLLQHYRQLDWGLPAEDEFAVTLAWLGRCSSVHKLDQVLSPQSATTRFVVPDLLAVMDYGERIVPLLVEVKSTRKLKLSMSRSYYARLRAYGDALGLPVTVAWQIKPARIWSLFDLEAFSSSGTVDLTEAQQRNLLGVLAGDFAYVMPAGVGLHFEMHRLETLATHATTQEWRASVTDAYVTNGSGERVTELGPGLTSLVIAADLSETSDGVGDHVTLSYVVENENGMQFAHRALGSLLRFRMKGPRVNWRRLLGGQIPALSRDQLREEAEKGISTGFVRYVLDAVPSPSPGFLAFPA